MLCQGIETFGVSGVTFFFACRKTLKTGAMLRRVFFVFLLLTGMATGAAAQRNKFADRFFLREGEEENIRTIPVFSIYKNNYIVTGFSVAGGKIDKYNSDAKFQISLRHRLYKGRLPWNTYVFLTYTQKSFWDIYRASAPFSETNYNPTVGVGRNFIREGRLAGIGMVQLEHESNGRDSIWSRSWNKISLTGIYAFNACLTLEAKVWLPVLVEDKNSNLACYAGCGQFALTYNSRNRRFSASALMVKRAGWIFNANWQLEIACKVFPKDEQYLFMQFYTGYGENMIGYRRFSRYLRAGIVIKPGIMTIF